MHLDVQTSLGRCVKYITHSPEPSARINIPCVIHHVPDFTQCSFLYTCKELRKSYSALSYEYELTFTILKTWRLFTHFTALYQVLMFYRMVDRKMVLAFIKILMFEAEKITKRLEEDILDSCTLHLV